MEKGEKNQIGLQLGGLSIQEFLDRDEQKDLLRFLTAGSVDDGKSTLIGRLLFDSKKIYEDGTLSLTTRVHSLKDERLLIEDKILNLLKENNGFIPFCDASSPEEIKEVFNCSKNYFKKALGGLMKQRLISQDSEGTYLVK